MPMKCSVATDCSGMETPIMALQNLNVEVDHVFSCDVNKFAKQTIMANFPPRHFYDDLTKRDNSKAPRADLYVAGFPCQPFSTAGLQQGFKDVKGRGEIFFKVRDYLDEQRPTVFVLENVSGLVKINKGEYFQAIIESLEALGDYNIYHKILDTKEHGIPQSRRRIYMVGIKKSCDRGSFSFPEPVARPSINAFLEPPKPQSSSSSALPPKTASTARKNVLAALKELSGKDANPFKVPYIIDADSSPDRSKFFKEVCPCMTCSRGSGHWVTNRMRRMTKSEMMRLQGINPETFKVVVSDSQLGKQIGNAMSVNVLERLFARLLPAAGLVREGSVKDRWECGKIPAEFTGAVRKATKKEVVKKEAKRRSPSASRTANKRART